MGQKEPAHGFDYWQQKIYWYIDNSQFGIKWAAIYDNLNQDREKEPLIVILGNGTQKINMLSI
jgi:hypothetical protein